MISEGPFQNIVAIPQGGLPCGGGTISFVTNLRANDTYEITFNETGSEYWRWTAGPAFPFGEEFGKRMPFVFNSPEEFNLRNWRGDIQEFSAYPFPFVDQGSFKFITDDVPINGSIATSITASMDETSNSEGTVLVAGQILGSTETLHALYAFTRAPDENTGPAFVLSEFAPNTPGSQFGFDTGSGSERFICAPAHGYVDSLSRATVPSLFFQLCDPDLLGPQSYQWNQEVSYDEIRIYFDQITFLTDKMLFTGIVGGGSATITANLVCQSGAVLADVAAGHLVFFDAIFFQVTVWTNFSIPPDVINGPAPSWFDPTSSPSNFGFTVNEPVTLEFI